MYDMKSHSEMLRVAKIQTCNMHLITLNSTLQFNMKMPKNATTQSKQIILSDYWMFMF